MTEDMGGHNKDKSYEASLCGRKMNSNGARSWRIMVLGVMNPLFLFPSPKELSLCLQTNFL
jgi:hypothetical protein